MCDQCVSFSVLDSQVLCIHPKHSNVHLNYLWVLRVMKAFIIGNPLGCEVVHMWKWWPPCMEASHLFRGMQEVVYHRWVRLILLWTLFSLPFLFLKPPCLCRLNLDLFIRNSHLTRGCIWGLSKVTLITVGIWYFLNLVSFLNIQSSVGSKF